MVDNVKTYIDENNFPKNTTTEISNASLHHATGTVTTKLPANQKLKGKLEIKDYQVLTKIDLEKHNLEEVVIINCPLLSEINVGSNKITKLDITKIKVDNSGNSVPSVLKDLLI